MTPRKREAREKRRKIRVKGGMDLRANFVATKENPKSKAMAVRARKGSMSTSSHSPVPA
jgi:hypothetical protein